MKKSLSALSDKAISFFSPFFKRAILIIGITCSCYSANAQSFDLGVSGSLGIPYLLNRNFSAPGTEQKYHFSLSDNIGLLAALNLKYIYQFEIGVLAGTLRQGYSGSFSTPGTLPGVRITYVAGESYSALTTINLIEIPMLFRHSYKSGSYLELGSGYEIISGAGYSASYSNPSSSVSYNTISAYPPGNFLLVAGFGWNKRFAKGKFYLNTGARFTYGLLDIQGVDGHGQAIKGAGYTFLYPPNIDPYYPSYRSTHSFDFSLNVGIFYRFSLTNVHDKEIEF